MLLPNLEATQVFAAEQAASWRPGASGATVVALAGDLGAGKTTFTQSLARALGVGEPVTSPTFVIQKVYELPASQPFRHLIHIDAYRLSGADELAHLGFGELLTDANNLIVVEWAERVASLLPPGTIHLSFAVAGEHAREVTIT